MGPEQAVTAHQLLRGKVFVPMHWGLVTLAYHSWTEPIERVATAAAKTDVQLVTPRPGQPFEPGVPADSARWWPKLAYESAEQHAIVSGNVVLRASGAAGASPSK